MKYFVKTFGCQQNKADSERIETAFKSRGFTKSRNYKDSNYVIVNTCMIRGSAEERVYGLVRNLTFLKEEKIKKNQIFKIIVTGCMVGLAHRDKTGEFLRKIRDRMPVVDEFMPIEEVGFDLEPIRQDSKSAWVPVSNGCNNFCTFCVVPFTRGREISRSYEDIINECRELKAKGYRAVTLLGQNVNSYGADLLIGEKNIQVMRDLDKTYFENSKSEARNSKREFSSPEYSGSSNHNYGSNGVRTILGTQISNKKRLEDLNLINSNLFRDSKFDIRISGLKPIYVKHLGRQRIPTLFPYLLEEVARMGFEKVEFMSSNPWDFSDELIEVISRNENITRTVHLPIQSGDNNVLRRMNRWYTRDEYLDLVKSLKLKVKNLKLTTDIIVGFCGETDEEFENTVNLVKEVDFEKAYISRYSQRPMTAATKVLNDDVLPSVKKKRWKILDILINKPKPIKRSSQTLNSKFETHNSQLIV